MHIVIIIVLIIFWAVIQKSIRDSGHEPLSRGQLRYMRRKARKMDTDVSDVPYRPRKGTNPFGPTPARKSDPFGFDKIVRDSKRNTFKPPRRRK